MMRCNAFFVKEILSLEASFITARLFVWRSKRTFRRLASCAVLATLCLVSVGDVRRSEALEKPAGKLGDQMITPKFGESVDLNLKFTNEKGAEVSLRDLILPVRPAILIPAYYHCPRLCGLLLNGAVTAFNEMDLELGKDFSVVTLSFDTEETPADAAKRAETYRGQFRGPIAGERGWSFLVGKNEQVDPFMRSIGFSYLPDQGEFAHAATMVVITPGGKISQYFNGVTFDAAALKLGLVEASQGSIGTVMDQVLLFCFRFDHSTGKYTWHASLALRIGSVLSVIIMGLLLTYYIRRRNRI